MIKNPQKTVYVVDDDASLRKALGRLLKSAGYAPEAFASAEEFLTRAPGAQAGCLILDMRMTGMSGLDLQKRLCEDGFNIPIIFISAHDDPQAYEQAMINGAKEFLRKPFDESSLLYAVESVFGGDTRHE